MARSRWFYGLLGVAAITGGFTCLVNASALTIPRSMSTQNTVAKVSKQSHAIATEERSLTFHTAGIQKALMGDYHNAIVDYDQALLLSPKNPEIYYNRAVAHYSVGKSRLALQDLDRAIALQPTMAEAYANRGTVRLEAGDVGGAIADGKKAADLFEQQGEPELGAEMQDWLEQHKR